ncbi:MAG: hypothetical protein AAFQ51_03235 [Pseudomonadota bacterium]
MALANPHWYLLGGRFSSVRHTLHRDDLADGRRDVRLEGVFTLEVGEADLDRFSVSVAGAAERDLTLVRRKTDFALTLTEDPEGFESVMRSVLSRPGPAASQIEILIDGPLPDRHCAVHEYAMWVVL